jgi:hypothetical protein
VAFVELGGGPNVEQQRACFDELAVIRSGHVQFQSLVVELRSS